jgi:hypothetical protein
VLRTHAQLDIAAPDLGLRQQARRQINQRGAASQAYRVAAPNNLAAKEIHRRRSDKPGDKARLRTLIHILRAADLSVEDGDHFDARLVRGVHGDCNPEGPGLNLVHIPTSVDGRHAGKAQRIDAGSYLKVDSIGALAKGAFTYFRAHLADAVGA